MKTLTKNETQIVAGADGFMHCVNTNSWGHMGSGRNLKVKCYSAQQIATRGWHAHNICGGVWFCCSSDRGKYFHVGVENKSGGKAYYGNCITHDEGFMIDHSMPPEDINKARVNITIAGTT